VVLLVKMRRAVRRITFAKPSKAWSACMPRSADLLLIDFRGGFEEQIAGGPLIATGALHHENRDHPGNRI